MIIKNALVYTEDHKFEKKDVSRKETGVHCRNQNEYGQ